MSLTTSIFAGAQKAAQKGSKFIDSSAYRNNWQQAAMVGAGAMAAFGATKGAFSSDSTIVGGTIGGGTFGAAAGAAAATLLHHGGEGLRSSAKTLMRGMSATAGELKRNSRGTSRGV